MKALERDLPAANSAAETILRSDGLGVGRYALMPARPFVAREALGFVDPNHGSRRE